MNRLPLLYPVNVSKFRLWDCQQEQISDHFVCIQEIMLQIENSHTENLLKTFIWDVSDRVLVGYATQISDIHYFLPVLV